jgi:prepilin-type N-terminal cleavage/methylation domain-containing protein
MPGTLAIRSSTGFTLIELLIVVAIIAIIAAVAVPGLLRARMSGNEASAIGSLRAINSGQTSYSSSCAFGGYAVSLKDLAKEPAGGSQGFISPDLYSNAVVKSGYVIALAKDAAPGVTDVGIGAATCNASANNPASSYVATADPVTSNATGTRYFATDSRGTILFSTAAPIPNPIPAGTAVVQ